MTEHDVQRTLDEHHGCMVIVAEVDQWLDRYRDGAADWSAGLSSRLRKLDSALKAHFKGEEESLFRKLPVDYPHLARQLKELEAEHPKMLETLENAIRRAEKLGGETMAYHVRELKAQVQLLIATLRRHEAEENELVMSAQWTAIGASD